LSLTINRSKLLAVIKIDTFIPEGYSSYKVLSNKLHKPSQEGFFVAVYVKNKIICLSYISKNKNKNMNKADLIAKVAEEAALTKVQAENAINSFTGAISKSLSEGESVTLIGFGTFSVSERAARTGRNPQTGAALKIAAKKLPKFAAGKALKESVDKPKKKTKK